MNYSQLKREILLSLRGEKTQQELSRELGFSFNQVGKWEADLKILKWSDFAAMILKLDRPLKELLRDLFYLVSEDPADAVNVLRCLRNFNSFDSIESMAASLGRHPSVLKRWLSGTTEPDVEAVFQLMDLRPEVFTGFVTALVPLETVPSLRARMAQFQAEANALAEPQTTLVALCLELEEYKKLSRHSDAFISDKTGLSLSTVRRGLQHLEDCGNLHFNGRIYSRKAYVSHWRDKYFVAKFRRYWTEKSLQRLSHGTGLPHSRFDRSNLGGFLSVSVSDHAAKQITELLAKLSEELQQIVANDKRPSDQLRIVVFDSFSPDDTPDTASVSPMPESRPSLPHAPL